MIDFACKKIELNEVLKCSLGLTNSDLEILLFLLRNNDYFSSSELEEKLDFDLSTIQRSLKKLHSKDLIKRSQKNLSNGGYVFEYQSKGKNFIKEKVMNIIKDWRNNVEERLDNL